MLRVECINKKMKEKKEDQMIEDIGMVPVVKGPDDIDFKITDKVANLLMKISENNYASRNEIGEFFTSYGYRFRVLKGLKKLGMISEIKTHVVPATAYYLTAQGYEFLESMGMLRVPDRFSPSNYRIATCMHTLVALKVQLIFERHRMVKNWSPERVLNFAIRRVSRMVDAEFDLGESHCGLEVELTLKAPRVLKENLEKLRARRDLDNIFWVIRNRNVFDSIRVAYGFEKGQNVILNDDQKRHLFLMIDDLGEKRLEANVFNLNNKSVVLKDIGSGTPKGEQHG